MALIYEICGDEAWTHTSQPLNRYWCFFGGLFALESDADRLETELRHCAARHNYRNEIKWGKLSIQNLSLHKELVDILFNNIEKQNFKYRQAFLDRAFVHVPSPADPQLSDLDIQFRICYQFLKHSFGLSYMPKSANGLDTILIRLDTHSSQKHKEKLRQFTEQLPRLLNRTDLDVRLAHVRSHHLMRLCICDVLAGAAGWYGNRMHDRRNAGVRGMTPKQKCKLDLAKYIYDGLRRLDKITRGSRAFNWFESTGHDGNVENRFNHKLRIWKVHPQNYKIDRGWQNSHLDNQGRYQGPDIVVPASIVDPFSV
jgi:hypothetical protein